MQLSDAHTYIVGNSRVGTTVRYPFDQTHWQTDILDHL